MSRRIDHLVLAATDLGALADFYRRLGFQVGARNRHPWGTVNHLIQLRGGFLELISAEAGFHLAPDRDPHNFSFSGFIDAYLKQGQGAAMAAVTTDDAAADSRAFRVEGIGDFEPFHFERSGKRADARPVKVAFTLAFARSPAIPHAGFFSCQHHYPENFWDPAMQQHANGVSALKGFVVVADNPADHAAFFSNLLGVRSFSATSAGLSFELEGDPAQKVSVLTPAAFAQRYGAEALPESGRTPAIAACLLGVSRMQDLRDGLAKGAVAFAQAGDDVVIAPQAALGSALIFQNMPASHPH